MNPNPLTLRETPAANEGAISSLWTTPARGELSRPKLGFAGVGWIGRHRLEALVRSGLVEVSAIADAAPEAAAGAALLAPGAQVLREWEQLLAPGLDGVVIATPSALHAQQASAALGAGMAVFCQKPLGRTGPETALIVDAARAANRLLAVDLSYRFVTGIRKIHDLCVSGELGEIYAADLVFHNASAPDKPWFYERSSSGGGCVMDLGIHLVDLALWNLGFPAWKRVSGRLYAGGKPSSGREGPVEDYAEARLDLESGTVVRLACSWRLPAGCNAIISGAFYGTRGGAAFHNVDGSFYDFKAERFFGTKRETLACAPEEWGGRAAVDWAARVAQGTRFDRESEHLVTVARALDAIYEQSET